jgi:uncharacterized repeat protein (TIGR03803 family)
MRITPSGPVRLTLAVFVIAFMCMGSAGAATEKILHSFNPYPHGLYPNPGVLADSAGNLYGTTSGGGTYLDGTVFKLMPNSHGGWTETVIYTFTGGTDGRAPQSGLVFDQAGNLYGTSEGGYGLVFKLTPNGKIWTFSVLYNFTGGVDGSGPSGNMVFDGAGNLYGAAQSGGNLSLCYSSGCGTIFKLTPSTGTWTLTVLYTFPGGSGGAYPNGGLTFDQSGSLYGTAGGVDSKACSSGQEGCGAVFELKPSGNSWTESVLYSFTGLSDGDGPQGPLIIDQAGNLYGAAGGGGVGSCRVQGCGLVFELTPSGGTWTKTPLYAFTGRTDGAYPKGGLVFDSAGNLYGAASAGGSPTCGTLFQLTPSIGGWTQSVLHSSFGPQPSLAPLKA